ncbi:MAG: VWA domain-containing protein [Spongiibacteraceae bacterium]|nr:VWA domain-containing protein [Spongiibacteraceae bacterium]
MLTFELPWALILTPLPLLAYWLLPKTKQQQAALRVPFFDALADLPHQGSSTIKRSVIRLSTLTFIWLCLIASASGPTWIGESITLPSSGRDLLIAVDLSESMKMNDMILNGERAPRIIAVKAVLHSFIERRKGDRLGLILFGSQAYVQAPLTFDRATVQQFLNEAQIGFAGKQTAIGDAIGLSVKRLRERPGDRHVMILLTDGANTAGQVKPVIAAQLAAEQNIVIYTIGVGADELTVPGLFGGGFGSRTINPSKDLDEKTLQEIAKLTGGQYFRARNPLELLKIYQLLDQLEPVEDKQQTFRPRKALFYWPMSLALLLSFLCALSFLPWGHWFSAIKTPARGAAE